MAGEPPSNSKRIPYPAINRHGVVGDRRTAALIAADGTLDWLCLPHFDGSPVFAALVDANCGGFWKFGPAARRQGDQQYLPETATLETNWTSPGGRLRLTDLMGWPETERAADQEDEHLLIRRLRCLSGKVHCCCEIRLPSGFGQTACDDAPASKSLTMTNQTGVLHFWSSRANVIAAQGTVEFAIEENQEVFVLMSTGKNRIEWTLDEILKVIQEAESYWRWGQRGIRYTGPRSGAVKRAALVARLLTFAPTGALVAAPTTSIPERIGGDWNCDYRLCWTRDASLMLSTLSLLDDLTESRRYLNWIHGLGSSTGMPLQVLYGITGKHEAPQEDNDELAGYRQSKPVRFGNHAYRQIQHDVFGYFALCMYDYLICGGEWQADFWDLCEEVGNFVAAEWRRPGNGIWELRQQKHFVSSKVMSWVAMDRLLKIGETFDRTAKRDEWSRARDEIFDEVMQRGWSDRLQSFRQHYDADNLDASTLLIPLMGFLPMDHPRVLSTIDAVAKRLSIDQFVYRFDPEETEPDLFGGDRLMMGEYEGAFLPCTFWLSACYARMGEIEKAEAILEAVEQIAGPTGLLAEAVDPRDGTFRGNFPLLFSHVEYVRAILEVDKACLQKESELGVVQPH